MLDTLQFSGNDCCSVDPAVFRASQHQYPITHSTVVCFGLSFFRSSDSEIQTKIEVRPAADFSFPLAKSRLVSVSVHIHRTSRTVSSVSSHKGRPDSADQLVYCSEMDEMTQREAQIRLSNVVDLQSTESVSQFLFCARSFDASCATQKCIWPMRNPNYCFLGWLCRRCGQFLVAPWNVPSNGPKWSPSHDHLHWLIFDVRCWMSLTFAHCSPCSLALMPFISVLV